MVKRAYPQELVQVESYEEPRVRTYGAGAIVQTSIDSDFIIQLLKNQATMVIVVAVVSLALGVIVGYLLSKLEKEK